jgi:CRP-like cAMP-binding protein
MLWRKKREREISEIKVRARVLEVGQRYRQSVPLLTQLCQLEPDEPRWQRKLGEALEQAGDPAGAVKALRRAAELYLKQGVPLKAIALGRKVLDIDPTHRETQGWLARRCGSDEFPAVVVDAQPPPEPARPKRRTIPPGASLDAVDLREAVPRARRRPTDPGEGAVFEIPIDAGPPLRLELPPTPLFSSLDRGALRMLIEKVSVRRCDEGEIIIQQGAVGDSLFVLVEGEVVVFREEEPPVELECLREGAFFGEIGLLTHQERSATVQALSECTVLEISSEVIGDLVEHHPPVLTVMLRFFRERLIDTLVETSDLFAPFGDDDQRDLIKRFAFIEAEAGSTLVRRGQPADGLYVLLCGQLELHRPDQAGDAAPRALDIGDLFGDTSLLQNAPSEVTARTVTKCWLLQLDRDTFRDVIMTHSHVLAVISERVTRE